jgi:N-acetylmuramoyl-L-alanine amidase/AmpD protein
VDTVVLHHTSTASLRSVISHFSNPKNEVSAHFTIGRDGSVVQHVPAEMAAWHAGPSLDHQGRRRVNLFSIGIELVNTGSQPYPEAQIQSLRSLLKGLIAHFPIRFIVSHRAVAMPRGRKNDPTGFPWKSVQGLGPKVIP